MRRFFRNNGLTLVLGFLFLAFWAGQAVAGFRVHNLDSSLHGQPPLSFSGYLVSGHFWQATGENWESEFLQMGAYVVLTSFLYQKGSAESKDPDAPDDAAQEGAVRRAAWLRRNSLSLGFLPLFAVSLAIHAGGGLIEFNQERQQHGQSPAGLREFLTEAEFWFQSFQNWQSEFLAVLSIVILTIFLRQAGSPESKEVGVQNLKPVNDP